MANRILITGNMGYVGPVLVRHLRRSFPNTELIGYDAGYFAHCLTGATRLPETKVVTQWFGDVRDFPTNLLDECDAVVHLSAISNDPMGKRFEGVTDAINHMASVNIARAAADHGVKRFVFASSCSMYGYAEGGVRRESDVLNPLTAYAKSKVASETGFSAIETDMQITSLRFSTACGFSDRIRLDLVLNDFVASALTTGTITVLSDGTPWRPLIHVQDMARAIEWGLTRESDSARRFLAINVGSSDWNYQVSDLANAVARLIPGTSVNINTSAPPDKRSYKVDFRLYEELAPEHQPLVTLEEAILDLKSGLESMKFATQDFRNSQFMRLKVLEEHIKQKELTEDLRWI